MLLNRDAIIGHMSSLNRLNADEKEGEKGRVRRQSRAIQRGATTGHGVPPAGRYTPRSFFDTPTPTSGTREKEERGKRTVTCARPSMCPTSNTFDAIFDDWIKKERKKGGRRRSLTLDAVPGGEGGGGRLLKVSQLTLPSDISDNTLGERKGRKDPITTTFRYNVSRTVRAEKRGRKPGRRQRTSVYRSTGAAKRKEKKKVAIRQLKFASAIRPGGRRG